MSDQEVTKWFEDAFLQCGGGSSVLNCVCGRTLYADDAVFEDDERVEMDKLREENPEQFILLENADCAFGYEIFGVLHVYGCPCNSLHRLESFLWSARVEITNYLSSRLQDDAAALEKLSVPLALQGKSGS